MAQNITTGTAGKHNTLQAQWARDIEDQFTDISGEEGKLTKVLSMATDDDVSATHAEWGVTRAVQPFTTIRAGFVASATALTIPVADGGVFIEDSIVLHPSGETARVASVDNTEGAETITLESRSRGAIPAATWAAGDTLMNQGTAKDDGDTLGQARISQDVIYENPVQIYWERVEFDGTTIAINERKGIYGGDYVARKRGQVLKTILQQMDINALFGEAATTAGVGANSVRTLGGVRNHIAAANVATIATLDRVALENYIANHPDLRMNGDDLLVVSSDQGAMGMNRYATPHLQVNSGGKRFGFRLTELVTPLGVTKLMPHYNLSRVPQFQGLFLILNQGSMRKAVLRKLKLYGDVNTGLVDVRTDAYLGQHTFKWGAPEEHGEINGVTAYAA